MTKQRNINEKFIGNEIYKKGWEEAGFDSERIEAWLDSGLGLGYCIFAWWLEEEKKLTPRQGLNIEELLEEYKSWRQEWCKDIVSLSPKEIMDWKKRGFNSQEVKEWMDVSLKTKEYEFASQLRKNGITPQQYVDFSSKNAQKWIDFFYPQEKRGNVKELIISKKDLEDSLKLVGFTSLEKLDCSRNQLTNLDLSDCVNLKEIDCSKNQLDSLIISNLSNLQKLDCKENKLTNLDCSSCFQLKILSCSKNKIVNLNLFDCLNITQICCNENRLTGSGFLHDLLGERLEIIDLSVNDINENLSPFRHFINLRELHLSNNQFIGSLESLRHLGKLEKLSISSTDIGSGLEYLPDSVKKFYCSSGNSEKKVKLIEKEIDSYATNKGGGEYNFSAWRDENIVKMVPTLPPSLVKEKVGKLEESYDIKKKYYDNKIYPETSRKIDENRVLSPKELPTRLYNIEDKKLTEEKTDIKNYAILSYVWGQTGDLSDEAKNELGSIWNNVKYKNDVNPAGYKSWKKAIEACQHPSLNINYLWMDQLCINQSDNEEKAAEVPKMGQYYSNAVVTLIGIQTKAKVDEEELDLLDILKNITRSEWFTRSWTFQEGWLSKHTIFMFDDILVDGRQMATLWVFQQPSHIGINFSKADANQGSKKVATPIGWVYYQKGYKTEDKVSLRLHEVLREIKSRGRGNPVDGIYSTLGLLPYGNDKDIKVEYKPRECELCEDKIEQKDCKHEEKHKKWAIYTTKDLEDRLLHIMKIAIKNGYGEPLAWHGMGNGWLPQINEQGSTTIEGGIKVDYVSQNKEEIFQSDGSLKITGAEYIITKSGSTMSRWDQSSSIESGARERKVGVVVNDKEEELELSGTKTILSVMSKLVKDEKNNIRLLIPNRYQWRSTKPFAILVELKENNHYGLGLVEISEGSEKLQELKEKEVIIQRKSIIWANEKEKEISLKEELQTKWQNLQKQIAELSIQEQERLLTQIQVEVNKN